MRLFLFFAFALLACSAHASPISPYTCRGGTFVESNHFQMAEVKTPRSHFFNDMENCPYRQTCRLKAYVIKGDRLLVAQQQDGWSCVLYQSKKDDYVGWMHSNHLRFLPTHQSDFAAWVGQWQTVYGQYRLRIRLNASKTALYVMGDGEWHGLNTVNSGSFEGQGVPENNRLTIVDSYGLTPSPDDCRVTLQLINGVLIAHDNHNCGGMNVNFSNAYRKIK